MVNLCPQPAQAPTVDMAGAARAQGAANVDTAKAEGIINNPNIYSPTGNQTVNWSPNGQATIYQQLSAPEQQKLAANQALDLSMLNTANNQINRVGNSLSSPFQFQSDTGWAGPGTNKQTGIQSNIIHGGYAQGNSTAPAPGMQTSYSSGGNVSDAPSGAAYGSAGSVNGNAYGQASGGPSGAAYGSAGGGPAAGAYGLAGGGPTAGSFGYSSGGPSAGAYGYSAGGPSANAYGTAGSVNSGQYSAAGNLNTSDVARMPVNAGTTGQQAIMSRLSPQIQQDDASNANTLKNQGITLGSEAYDNAMRVHNQSKNDLLTQAGLQGIGLDMSANAQGMTNALNTGNFYNQAQAQNFGQNIGAQQLQNQAIAQMFGQGTQATAAQNAAIEQNYGRASQSTAAQNLANSQNFDQASRANSSQNAAIAQNFGQGQVANTAQNQAIAQNFGQGQAAASLGNQAIGQNFAQGSQGQDQQNAAIAQNYGQGLSSQQSQNAAVAQRFGQSQAQMQDYNAAQSQNYNNQLAGIGLSNSAQAQNYNQALSNAQFQNTSQAQQYQQQLQQRELPINEIAALTSGTQINMPTYQQYTGSQIQAAPIFQAAQSQYNQGLQNAGMINANNNAFMSGLASIGGQAANAGIRKYG